MSEEEQGSYSHPPLSITPTGMDKGGISRKILCLPPQPNPLAETGRIDPLFVGEWIHPNGTSADPVDINPKEQRV